MNPWDEVLQAESRTPPPIIYDQLRTIVSRDLNPGLFRISAKVVLIHTLTSLVSLALCPQYGVGPWGGESGVMAFLMSWGWAACAAGCGAIFMMGTGALSALLLSPDEKRAFSRQQIWIFSGLVALSWALLMLLSPSHTHEMTEIESSITAFSSVWNLVWMTAAVLSAVLFFQTLKRLASKKPC